MPATVDFSALSWRDAADVALQRTTHLKTIPRIGSLSYIAWAEHVPVFLYAEAMLRKKAILGGAMSDIEREFATIRDYLDSRTVSRMIDIGCGHGLIDLLFWREYRCALHLVDIEKTADRHHDWNSKGAGYASLKAARSFLIRNGVPGEMIQATNPKKQMLAVKPGETDLVISLLSAGFHYPVSEYAATVLKALRPGGVFIFDARNGAGQDTLEGFSSVEAIDEGPKRRRLAAVK